MHQPHHIPKVQSHFTLPFPNARYRTGAGVGSGAAGGFEAIIDPTKYVELSDINISLVFFLLNVCLVIHILH